MLFAKLRELVTRRFAPKPSIDIVAKLTRAPSVARVEKGQTVAEAFFGLAEKYGLLDRVDLNDESSGFIHHWRLIAILPDARLKWATARIAKTGTPELLPPAFIAEVRELAVRYEKVLRRDHWRAEVTFEVHPTGLTLADIEREQDAWNLHCEAMWGNS